MKVKKGNWKEEDTGNYLCRVVPFGMKFSKERNLFGQIALDDDRNKTERRRKKERNGTRNVNINML